MQIISTIMLILHIVSGFLSLLVGLFSVVSKKGGKIHRLSGKVFFYSMLGVCFTALFISIVKSNQFLLLIAIFAFYQTYSGWRAVNNNKSLLPNTLDWIVLIAGTLNSFYMIYTLQLVLMVFGTIGFIATTQHWLVYVKIKRRQQLPPLSWLRMHISMMMGAYIATITAFVVVNYRVFSFIQLPAWFFWLFPSMVLSPLIAYWTRKYTGKKERSVA